jgi:hypothetical protein
MAAAYTLKPHDRIKVRHWPGTAGQTFTVSEVDEARGHVKAWDSQHAFRAFPLANVVKVAR